MSLSEACEYIMEKMDEDAKAYEGSNYMSSGVKVANLLTGFIRMFKSALKAAGSQVVSDLPADLFSGEVKEDEGCFEKDEVLTEPLAKVTDDLLRKWLCSLRIYYGSAATWSDGDGSPYRVHNFLDRLEELLEALDAQVKTRRRDKHLARLTELREEIAKLEKEV